MTANPSKEIFLKDYRSPDFFIDKTDLDFEIGSDKTIVTSRLSMRRNGEHQRPLELDGVNLKPLGFKLDGQELDSGACEFLEKGVRIQVEKEAFVLETKVEIDPKNNFSCEGFYQSGDIFCTQNEAQGFRKITYYLDRPDVMSRFTTTLKADAKSFPVLLSNGNKVADSLEQDGRRVVVWEDPFPKPSYLFAVVAGDLAKVADTYTTKSGRRVDLEFYVDHGNEDKCGHAIESLKNSMRWDEEKFGLEYDLDTYMVVAVDSFNMGAMENKGLNIFNSAYVLARPDTATDSDFQGIESVIGHEYFHNWTGNRVTCRDWFQLTLKEGLTVFRDQEFSADMLSRPVKRIDDVLGLRNHQFPEDQGPMSHPIQPKSYIEINNFYTSTIYEKGAEVIRMIHTLLGEENFRKGMDLYFERHDGQAVTTDDFVNAMADASGVDLNQFKMWYHQNGTPKLKVLEEWDEENQVFTLRLQQEAKINHDAYSALHMPMRIGLFYANGDEAQIDGNLELRRPEETFTFKDLRERPILSINRGFTAPVIIEREISDAHLATLMAFESEEFARYEAAQTLYKKELNRLADAWEEGEERETPEEFFKAFGALLGDQRLEPAYLAYALGLPSESELDEENEVYRIDAVHHARQLFRKRIADRFADEFAKLYQSLKREEFKLDANSMGERALRQVCLNYLCSLEDDRGFKLASEQFDNATNMSEEISALSFLASFYPNQSAKALESFYQKWKGETLVMQKWLSLQAVYDGVSIERLKELEASEVYDKKVPNLVRSVVGSFANKNRYRFNHPSGDGYAYVADKVIELDAYNPQLASRLAKSMNHVKRLDEKRRIALTRELERILAAKLSDDTFEVVDKILRA